MSTTSIDNGDLKTVILKMTVKRKQQYVYKTGSTGTCISKSTADVLKSQRQS